jgi:uncharacterized membrane protein YbaN (DUF454 family)
VGLGALGAALPGLPATIFFIAASWCFTRSSPRLQAWLLRNRVFRPYLVYLDGSRPLPPRARAMALAAMWTAVTISVVALWSRGPWPVGAILAAAAVGTWAILRFRRGRPRDA